MSKKGTTKINITISQDLVKKINEKNYNRNKLLINLLEKYVKNKPK